MRRELKKLEDNVNLVERIGDENVEMGLWPTIFGWRVRVGERGSDWVEADWCCGADHQVVSWTYAAMRALLESGFPVSELRSISMVKPWPKDEEFTSWLMGKLRDLEVSPVKHDLEELRRKYMREHT